MSALPPIPDDVIDFAVGELDLPAVLNAIPAWWRGELLRDLAGRDYDLRFLVAEAMKPAWPYAVAAVLRWAAEQTPRRVTGGDHHDHPQPSYETWDDMLRRLADEAVKW